MKAKQIAMEIYPPKFRGYIADGGTPIPQDLNEGYRDAFIEGYRLAIKNMPKWKKTNPMKGGCWSGETFVIQGKHPKLAYEQWTIDVEELFKKLLKEE